MSSDTPPENTENTNDKLDFPYGKVKRKEGSGLGLFVSIAVIGVFFVLLVLPAVSNRGHGRPATLSAKQRQQQRLQLIEQAVQQEAAADAVDLPRHE